MPGTEDQVLSGSVDKVLKLWEIDPSNEDDPYKFLSSVQLNEAIERFIVINRDDKTIILVANGNLLSLVELNEHKMLVCLQSIHVFQTINGVATQKMTAMTTAANWIGMPWRISFSTPDGEVNGVAPVKFMAA